MTHRCWAALLILTMLGVCSHAFSQNLVSPKLLPPAATLRAGIAARNLAFDAGNDSPNQAVAPHRHWSKTGKILTAVGVGLIGGGVAAIVHGQNTRVACVSNGAEETCAEIAWKATGAVWLGGGSALVIIGATRRTDE
jgi:hypothetical protein